MSEQNFTVDFEPVGKRSEALPGDSLLDVAQQAGVELASICGGVGICDSCKLRLVTGHLTPHTLEEEDIFDEAELAVGWRLACQAMPLSDVKLEIPPESLTTEQRLQIEGQTLARELAPLVQAFDIELPPPTLHDLRDDVSRLRDAWAETHASTLEMPLAVLQNLPGTLRRANWQVRLAVREDGTLVAVLPQESILYGLAVDIGTTSIAAYLVDLGTGTILAKGGAMNPQIAYGEDVISRIVYINEHENGAATLQKRAAGTINDLVTTLTAEAGVSAEQIVDAVVVGNTAMHHIFCGLDVRQLGEAPFISAVDQALNLPARDLGLALAPGAKVYLPPNIAGYVGADHIAMLMASDIWQQGETAVAIDIGTNTEVTLIHDGEMLSCSCASGPAFEGAHITDGMRASPGAIERVRMIDNALMVQTIGDRPAVGLCGSGILDAVAVMSGSGMLDRRGAFVREHPLTTIGADNQPRFVLANAATSAHGRAVTINRRDVAEIQLAKAAIRAGIELLLENAAIRPEQIDHFIIAGAFGTYIDIDSALAIGMFPTLPLDHFTQIGNAAGMGAYQLLVSSAERHKAEAIAKQIDYIELTTHSGFQDMFVRQMTLGAWSE